MIKEYHEWTILDSNHEYLIIFTLKLLNWTNFDCNSFATPSDEASTIQEYSQIGVQVSFHGLLISDISTYIVNKKVT